ncbi:MAG: DNA-binding CsgD family transcriptional regulator [Alcanivorax sp.]
MYKFLLASFHDTEGLQLLWGTETSTYARCVDCSGTRDFYEPFLDLIHDVYGVDQCMIFLLDAESRMECLLSRNFLNNVVAAPLARSYIEDKYNFDPNITSLRKLHVGETQTIHLSDTQHRMTEGYRNQFFEAPHLIDKVSILTTDDNGSYYINFYRSQERRTFVEDKLFTNPGDGRLIAALLTQHYRLNKSLSREGPLVFLSQRERQVCQGILQGEKMETISATMEIATSSVITYKKRAYAKLGINSRASLFALCHKQ